MGDMADLAEVGARIDRLLGELAANGDPATVERAEEVVRLLMELYGAGLERVLDIVAADADAGERLRGALAGDEVVAGLLILHGIHPLSLDERIGRALEEVRPYLGSHAGGVAFLGVDADDVVHLRLEGSCDGCPSSTVTVKLAIERALLEAAPEIAGVHVEGQVEEDPTPRGLVQIQPLGGNGAGEPPARGGNSGGQPRPRAGTWARIDDAGLVAGQTKVVEIEGLSVLLCSARGHLYAYTDSCASCASSLEGAALNGDALVCPACGSTFDVRLAGRSTDDARLHLDPLPLLVGEGGIDVAVPAPAGR
jgi:Fe-S cluster biogenesis protein NfuA/nitrite reductase/ring-hydroxylating ferredoxin subunit